MDTNLGNDAHFGHGIGNQHIGRVDCQFWSQDQAPRVEHQVLVVVGKRDCGINMYPVQGDPSITDSSYPHPGYPSLCPESSSDTILKDNVGRTMPTAYC